MEDCYNKSLIILHVIHLILLLLKIVFKIVALKIRLVLPSFIKASCLQLSIAMSKSAAITIFTRV